MQLFDRILGKFTHDIGIDLGTANTLVALNDYGIVFNEPSIVAINNQTKEVLAVGKEARHMIGRTPSHIVSMNPLQDGVIYDFDSTEAMIRYFIQKVHKNYPKMFNIPRPRVLIGIPSKITEVEVRAVIDAANSAGARKVYVIEEPMAAAIGARLPIEEANGTMIVDIGGGTTDIAVISLGGIVVDNTIRVAGNEMDQAIVEYIRYKYNLLVGEKMGEDIKIQIGTAMALKKREEIEVKGRDLISGLPKVIRLSNVEVREAILPVLNRIADAVVEAIEKAPPEIISDLLDDGIMLTGGGALINGIDRFLSMRVKTPVSIVDDPLMTVVKGTQILLGEIELLEKVQLKHDEIF